MLAVCMVAHPDDCVIFGYSYIHAHPELDWTIAYLTYRPWDSRAQEMANFWAARGINCIFLGYPDIWESVKNHELGFDAEQSGREIGNICQGFDLVLTHDAEGDYGHVHHKHVHTHAQHPNRVLFAGTNQGNCRLGVPRGTYSLDELPEHGSIVQGFHQSGHVNEYTEPEHVKNLIASLPN